MQDKSNIALCEPDPFIYFENGQLAVTDGSFVWLVIVTCEAMRATATPPEKSLKRLVRYKSYYRDLAAEAILGGDDIDGKVWVTEAMVRSSMPSPIGFVGRNGAVSGQLRHSGEDLRHARFGA
jgi:hypothetical protein